jgi:hypothetical protein
MGEHIHLLSQWVVFTRGFRCLSGCPADRGILRPPGEEGSGDLCAERDASWRCCVSYLTNLYIIAGTELIIHSQVEKIHHPRCGIGRQRCSKSREGLALGISECYVNV